MRRGMLLAAGVLALLLLPDGVSARSLMAINLQTGVTQSAGYTFVGVRSVFSGIVGVSYERALASSRFNKGALGIVIGYQPERSTLYGFVGAVLPVGWPAGIYDPVSRNNIPFFIDVGAKVRLFGSEQFGVCLSGDLRYHFVPGFAFAPAGLSPGIGLLMELGRM